MARPFKCALTPMAQPDTAVQLSSPGGSSEGSCCCSAKTVHGGTGAAAAQLTFASCRCNIASLETWKALAQELSDQYHFYLSSQLCNENTELHEQLVASPSTTICKSRVIARPTGWWLWALSDKQLVGQLFLQRTCCDFTETKLNEDREAAFSVCTVQVCCLCFLR